MNIIQHPSPNSRSRAGTKIDTLILHNTQGTFASALKTLCDPKSERSAHDLIDRDGTVYRLVPYDRKAWHAQAANARSIGIELVAWSGIKALADARGMAPPQEASLIELCRGIIARYGIVLDRILPHRAVCATACPSAVWATDAGFRAWVEKNFAKAK